MYMYFWISGCCTKCKPDGRPCECAWNAREDNTGRDDHFMDGVQHSVDDLGYRRLSRMRVSISLTSARSDCAVQSFVIRIVLCSATPYRNHRVERLIFRRQQGATWLDQHFRATDHNSIDTGCRHIGCELTLVCGLDHCAALILALRLCHE